MSDDVINFWFHWIIFLNLFIFTNFYLLQVNFFTLTRKFCQVVFKKVFNDHSQLKQWSHQFLLLLSFFLTKSSFKFFTNWISIQKQPSGDVLLGGFLWVCSQFAGEHRCGGMISIKLHMHLCGDHSSAWVFSCGFCFTFAKHFFGGITSRSSRPECCGKQVFLEISQNSQKNMCARVSFLN